MDQLELSELQLTRQEARLPNCIESQTNDQISQKIFETSQKQKNVKKRIFKPSKIITITFPTKLDQTQKNKRKFQTLIIYNDESGKKRRRVIKFGNYKQKDLVDNNQLDDRFIKKSIIDRLKKSDNVLQSNYWRQRFLNRSKDIHQNYIDILKENLI